MEEPQIVICPVLSLKQTVIAVVQDTLAFQTRCAGSLIKTAPEHPWHILMDVGAVLTEPGHLQRAHSFVFLAPAVGSPEYRPKNMHVLALWTIDQLI